MSLVEAYTFLFFDSLMSSMIFVSNTTMAYHVMYIFDGYNKYLMLLVAVLGSLFGLSINYLLGVAFGTVKKKKLGESIKYSRLRSFTQNKLFFISFFSFVPLLGVLATTFSGLMRVSFSRFFIAALLGRLLYYFLIS
ncbi:MAG: VTT domain-containing protein [Rickettsiales bacterium]